MDHELERYFKPNEEASYVMRNGQRSLVSVNGKNKIRITRATEQAHKKPVAVQEVFNYLDSFIDMLKIDLPENYATTKQIVIDGKKHEIKNNGIIVKNCTWKPPVWDANTEKYIFYDEKYDVIKEVFSLRYANDIIWLKFTKDGYVGVVADSFDINFNYDNSSGKLLEMLNPRKYWDDSFVFIFPLIKNMVEKYNRKRIETAVGNFLLEKGVPIIDYYSHNNFV